MGEWNRSSQDCTLETFNPENRAAILKHVETNNLGSILEDELMCIETISEKKKKGLFSGGDHQVIVSVVLTARWLVWAIQGDKSGIGVLSTQLCDAVVRDYAASEFFKLVPDTGIQVTAPFIGTFAGSPSEQGTLFIPLGEESIAHRFKDQLVQAAQKAKH